MTVPFSPDIELFVEQQLASGHYADRTAVLESALRLLQRDQEEAIQGIKAGLEDIATGRTQSLNEVFDELRRESKASENA